MVDQITDMILSSLNYFFFWRETGGDGDPRELGAGESAAIANVTPSEPEILCIQMGSNVGSFNVSVVVEKHGYNRAVSTNCSCQRQTTTEAEWNPRPSAYQPSYCLTATPRWPPKLRDNPVSDYMCVAKAPDSTHTIQVLSSNSTSRK